MIWDAQSGRLILDGRIALQMGQAPSVSATLFETESRTYPGEVGYSMQFSEGTFSTPFTYVDRVMNFGYNYSGSAPIDPSKATIFFQFESAYQLNNSPDPAMKVTEWHMNHIAVGGQIKRPFSFVGAWDGGFINAGMSGSQITISDLAANNRLMGYYRDGETVLDGAITAADTALTLKDARALANGQQFTVVAEGENTTEVLTVVSGGGTKNIVVTRGQQGTTASAHSDKAIVLLPAASLMADSSVHIFTDAATSFSVGNHARTKNWFVINRAGTTLSTSLSVVAPVQNLIVATNSNANGTAAIQVKANNGARTGSFSIDFGGNVVFRGDSTAGQMFFDFGPGGLNFRNHLFASALRVDSLNRFGFGVAAPTATLHIKAGSAAAGTAPVKLSAGPLLTTPENGVLEYDGTNLYFTTGGVRKTVVLA